MGKRPATNDDAAFWFTGSLSSLGNILSRITPEDAKFYRQETARAKADAAIAARILRDHAEKFATKADQPALLRAAKSIEKIPWYLRVHDDVTAEWIIPIELFGQKGDVRAYAIRCVDGYVPKDIPDRAAMIRDFLALVGVKTSSALVRSTLLNGKT
jgi:hypothetical protein